MCIANLVSSQTVSQQNQFKQKSGDMTRIQWLLRWDGEEGAELGGLLVPSMLVLTARSSQGTTTW